MRILVYGSRDFGRLVSQLVLDCGHEFCGFIDDFSAGEGIVGTLSVATATYSRADYGVAVAIGYRDLAARWIAIEQIIAAEFPTPPLIHPKAIIDPRATIAHGAIVMANSFVDMFSEIERFAVLWPGAVVSHDCQIGENTFISPNATVCGYGKTGRDCFLGAGSIVVDHIEVPNGTFVKAGSIIKRN
jgi:sugar O-acyltransferase (sialic acid O-acetyltransferase NeuD family)